MDIADDFLLRRLLWLRHGCPFGALYGDDGEMQCSECLVDFKRMDPNDIHARWMLINNLKLKKILDKIKKT